MRRWVVPAAVLTVLAPVTSGMVLPAAHAGLRPAGSCTYQAAGAAAVISPNQRLSEVQASAGMGANWTAPPSNCEFIIRGVFQLTLTWVITSTDAFQTPLRCVPDDVTSGSGGSTQCEAYGVMRRPSTDYSVSMSFVGTIHAVDDGVSRAVSCSAPFDTTGLAYCWIGDPNTVYTL